MARVASLFFTFLLFGSHIAFSQVALLTDEQARDVAASAIRRVYPEPCYSTYRNERLEGFLPDLLANPLVNNQISNSVYFYHLASDVCSYVTLEKGKPAVHTQATLDCCEYGIVAVDRMKGKAYWFDERGKKPADVFREFVLDEGLRPDAPPTLFGALYRTLVWGDNSANQIESFRQLRDLVQDNFHSAYSPYDRDNSWQHKFDAWWRRFRSHMSTLNLETTYQTTPKGTVIYGYGFGGFELHIPESDPPPKGTPKLFQWALLVSPDGIVEEQPSRIVYSGR